MQTYYDNRYWSMWKLPMFGCSDPEQVNKEVRACVKAFPSCYVRLVAFDSIAQCQTASFLVHRPDSDDDYTHPQVPLSPGSTLAGAAAAAIGCGGPGLWRSDSFRSPCLPPAGAYLGDRATLTGHHLFASQLAQAW